MKPTTPPAPTWQKQWLEQWKSAGVELALERERALRDMTDEQALAASEAVLALADPSKMNPGRRNTSGLVEQQALFHSRKASSTSS